MGLQVLHIPSVSTLNYFIIEILLFLNLIFILYWGIVDLQYCVSFMYSKVVQLYLYIYPFGINIYTLLYIKYLDNQQGPTV